MPQLVCAIQTLKRTQALIEQAANDAEPYERLGSLESTNRSTPWAVP